MKKLSVAMLIGLIYSVLPAETQDTILTGLSIFGILTFFFLIGCAICLQMKQSTPRKGTKKGR